MRRGELYHSQNPWPSRIRWFTALVLITSGAAVVIYFMLQEIRTYTMPTGGIDLTVPYSKYLVGETVSFTVKNNYNAPVFIDNSCPNEPLSVYKLDSDNKWQRLHAVTDSKNCTTQDRTIQIPAGKSMTATFANWPSLFAAPGKYRLVVQVQYYNALPHQDFEVIEKPIVELIKPKSTSSSKSSSSSSSSSAQSSSSSSSTSTASEENDHEAQTYTIYVTSAGNYSQTSVSMRAGDTLRIIYQSPYGSEVRTRFSGINGTTASASSVTVDRERTSGSRKFTVAGTWQFKADDHNGNVGIITVSP